MTTLDDIHYLVGQIDGRTKQLVDQLGIQDDRNARQHSELDGRIRHLEQSSGNEVGSFVHDKLEPRVVRLENRIAWYSGFAAAAGASATYLVKLFSGHST